MQPFFDCSVPHPCKPGYRMRPRDAVRLPEPMGIPGVYARATPGWFAAEERRCLDIPVALLGHPLDELEKMMHPHQPGDAGTGRGGLAAKGGAHD